MVFGRVRERARERREEPRESEREQGDRDSLRKSSTRPGARRQAGGGQGGVGARHRAASVRGEEDDRGVSGGGLGRQLELGQVG